MYAINVRWTMTDKLQHKGYWHLPDKPEEAVAGMLIYIPKKSISLELIGSFDQGKNSIEAFLNKKEEKIIHGITSGAEEIMLINCYPSGSVNFSCPFPIIRYTCQYLIIGKHVKSLTKPSFFKARVFFPVLTYWCHPCVLQNVVQDDENKEIRKIILSFDVFNDENEDTIHKTQLDENTHLYLKKKR